MKPPLFVRPFSDEEKQVLEKALRSRDGFLLRRAQILLSSARGQTALQIAEHLGCVQQTVRNVVHAFNENGLEVLHRKSNAPKHPHSAFDEAACQRLKEIAHQSPRSFGKARSTWSLAALAEVACEQGLTPESVSIETIRRTIKRAGANWKRAKDWIRSPDAQYALKKSNGIA